MIKSYEQFLLEEKVPPEIEEKYGQMLFGDFLKKREPDTEYESEVFRKLVEFVSLNFGEKINKNTISAFKELLKIKNSVNNNDFDSVLDPFFFQKISHLYRGLTHSKVKLIPDNYPIDVSKLQPIRETNQPGYYISVAFLIPGLTVTYKPQTEVQSLSTDPNNAAAFIDDDIGHGYLLIVENPKKMAKDLLFNTHFTNRVGNVHLNNEENEVLRISKKPLKGKLAPVFDIDVISVLVNNGHTIIPYNEIYKTAAQYY